MIIRALRHPVELHNIILEDIIEEKKTTERPQNFYVGQIKYNEKVKIFK